MRVIAVVISVNRIKGTVDLSIKPSYLNVSETWWIANRSIDKHASRWYIEQGKQPADLYDRCFLEREAIQALNEVNSSESMTFTDGHTDGHTTSSSSSSLPFPSGSGAHSLFNANTNNNNNTSVTASTTNDPNKTKLVQLHLRQVHHPLFANCGYKEAEDRLTREGKGAGEVLIRPSSKGSHMLAVTWAFQANVYLHIDIEEVNKQKGSLGLGMCVVIAGQYI
jgi:hypothetical protein